MKGRHRHVKLPKKKLLRISIGRMHIAARFVKGGATVPGVQNTKGVGC